jgi:hypothetical protein
MQDGHRAPYGMYLASCCFTYEDVQLLVKTLNDLYGLEPTIHKIKEGSFTIYIGSKSLPLLVDIIKPYIVPEMVYKIQPYSSRN